MTILFLLLAASLTIATAFLAFFIWAVRSGQYDDTVTPAMRMLTDDTDQVTSSPRRSACAKAGDPYPVTSNKKTRTEET